MQTLAARGSCRLRRGSSELRSGILSPSAGIFRAALGDLVAFGGDLPSCARGSCRLRRGSSELRSGILSPSAGIFRAALGLETAQRAKIPGAAGSSPPEVEDPRPQGGGSSALRADEPWVRAFSPRRGRKVGPAGSLLTLSLRPSAEELPPSAGIFRAALGDLSREERRDETKREARSWRGSSELRLGWKPPKGRKSRRSRKFPTGGGRSPPAGRRFLGPSGRRALGAGVQPAPRAKSGTGRVLAHPFSSAFGRGTSAFGGDLPSCAQVGNRPKGENPRRSRKFPTVGGRSPPEGRRFLGPSGRRAHGSGDRPIGGRKVGPAGSLLTLCE